MLRDRPSVPCPSSPETHCLFSYLGYGSALPEELVQETGSKGALTVAASRVSAQKCPPARESTRKVGRSWLPYITQVLKEKTQL